MVNNSRSSNSKFVLLAVMSALAFCEYGVITAAGKRLHCVAYKDTEDQPGIVNSTEVCDQGPLWYCFAVWSTRKLPDNSTVADVIQKGCFRVSYDRPGYDHPCDNSCIQRHDYDSMAKKKNVSGFCCCDQNYCNRNFTMVEYKVEVTEITKFAPGKGSILSGRINIIVGIVLATLTLVTLVALYYCFYKNHKKHQYTRPELEEKEPQGPSIDLTQLHLGQLIGRGRYGTVWEGTMYGDVMAVKVFSAEHRLFWQTERDLYIVLEVHPEILRFFAACDQPTDTSPEYLLLTEYHSRGSLMNYLQHTIINWKEMCVLGYTTASGLAYLHQEDLSKAAFAHRDLNSKNILVKLDGTCVLSDFGFAMNVSDATKPAEDGTLITEVGTLRYMAPEVLDGAVNLHDIQGALKQIDMYALSLVLWEVAMRCEDIFGRDQVPEYKLPFAAELGSMITAEHMHTFVVQKKARPGFPDAWKHNHSGLRSLKETIEDCWDQDGDARLLALCVKDRLYDLLSHYPNGLNSSSTGGAVQQFQQNFMPEVPDIDKNKVMVTIDENCRDSGTIV